MRNGPDFLGIGAQRAGSTWIHRVLSGHPQLWLPPIKELHYFDGSAKQRRWIHFRMRMWQPGFPTAWDLRFFIGGRDDDWYARLFSGARARGKITGEITPAYAVLDEATFVRIRTMNPEIKLIFSMREPVSRSWSAFRNLAMKNRFGSREWSLEKTIRYCTRDEVLARSRYTETIKRIERVFPPEQIHYCFFDELRSDPLGYAAGILDFLGVDSSDAGYLLPQSAVNASRGEAMPEEFVKALSAATFQSVEELCERFEGPPHVWRDVLRAVLVSGENR